MGAIKGPDKAGSIEITYGGPEAPFTGLDSSAPLPYIGPAALSTNSFNILPGNQTLTPAFLQFQTVLTLTATQTYIGSGDLNNQQFIVVYDSSNTSVIVYFGANSPLGSPWPIFTLTNSSSVQIPLMVNAPLPLQGSLTYKNINGICYFSFVFCPYILLHDNGQAAILTNYLGCAYLNELNGRLVAANIFQIPQAPPNTSDNPTPASETIQAVNTRFNTVTTTGTSMFFPAVAISGVPVTIQVNFNWGVVNNFPGGSNPNSYYGNCQIQYSTNTGATWSTIYNKTTIPDQNYNSGNLSITTYVGGVTNLNTVAVRAVVSAAGADLPNIVFTTATISSAVANVTNSPLPPVFNAFPFQFAWSAALQQYGIWNPIASTGFATGAGFNNLPDVEDIITGLIMEGPTGYIVREQGITEVSTLNSGIQPFEFNHLWASHLGVGSNYSYGTTQYGALGFLIANDDIYTIGYSGINVIAGKAKSFIYQTLISTFPNSVRQNLYAVCGLLNIDGDVSPAFVFTIQVDITLSPFPLIYIYRQTTGEWYFMQVENLDTAAPTTLFQPVAMNILNGQQVSEANRIVYMAVAGTNVDQYILPTTSDDIIVPPGAIMADIDFKQEEILFLRDVTIDGIGVFATVNGITPNITIDFIISGNYTSGEVIDSITSANVTSSTASQYIKLYPKNSVTGLLATGPAPNLSIRINNNGSTPATFQFNLAKVVLFGNIDTSQRPL